MKHLAPFALLLLLGGNPARAQQQQPAPTQGSRIRRELLELEQEVDKTLLREAMLALGRKELRPTSERPGDDPAKLRDEEDIKRLRFFIEEKKAAIEERSSALDKARGVPTQAQMASARPNPSEKQASAEDRQGLIEKVENVQVEVQLLQTQVTLFQQPLQEAINALASAELAASNDETQKGKADSARKEFEKTRAKFVEYSKRLQVEQGKLQSMQQMSGMGMMGGFR